MTFEQWIEKEKQNLKQRINESIESEKTKPSQMVRRKTHVSVKKKQIYDQLTLKDQEQVLNETFRLIQSKMPAFVSHNTWKRVSGEFQNCHESLKSYWSKWQNGEVDEKETCYKEMLGLSNGTLLDLYDFGVHLFEKEEFSEAEKIFFLLVTIAPEVSSFWVSYGRSLQERGNFTEALTIYNNAKKYHPDTPKLYLFSAECYNSTNEKGKEELELKKLQKLTS